MEHYVRHVLVEDDGQVVGIVSVRDLLGAYAAAEPTASSDDAVGQATGEAAWCSHRIRPAAGRGGLTIERRTAGQRVPPRRGRCHPHAHRVVRDLRRPTPAYDEFVELVAGKLPLLPRYRQKVRFVPGQLGRPVWVDDPHFNLAYHVRHTALPPPGGEASQTT